MLSLLLVLMVGSTPQANAPMEVLLDEEFKLSAGRTARVRDEGLVIGFSSVAEDSRCPEDVECVWSGNARIEISLSKQGRESAQVDLNTHLEPRSQSYAGYSIRLAELLPRPRSTRTIRPDQYEAVLIVSRSTESNAGKSH